jgi:hypothetical protein
MVPRPAFEPGLRTRSEEDLDRAKFFFDSRGISAESVELPYQSRTLHATDVSGTPIELCAGMSRLERVDQRFEALRGGGALRFDHYQVTAPDLVQATAFYAEMDSESSTIWSFTAKLSEYSYTSGRRATTLYSSAGPVRQSIILATS